MTKNIQMKSLIQVSETINRGITPSYCEENGILVINQKCIRNNSVNLNECRLTDYLKKKINDKKILKKGDILINSTGVGTVGRSAQIKEITEEITTDSHVTIVRPKNNINPGYLGYVIQLLEPEIENLAEGSTGQVELSRERLGNEIIIPLTSIENQEKITKLLSDIDKKIELNNKINNNLLNQIKSLYYDICYNYPEDVEKYDTSFGLIPLEYKIVTLNEIIRKNKDKVGSSNYKVLSAVNSGKLVLSDEYFNKQVFSKDISKYIVVRKKEFAYNPARINIGSIGINEFDFDGCVSPVYVAFDVQEKYKNFIRMFFKSKIFNIQVISRSNGSVRQTLNYDDFSKIELILPPISKIESFNNLYNLNETVINYNNKEIKKLTKLRDTLLPKLMSGEIDVSDINFDFYLFLHNVVFYFTSLYPYITK